MNHYAAAYGAGCRVSCSLNQRKHSRGQEVHAGCAGAAMTRNRGEACKFCCLCRPSNSAGCSHGGHKPRPGVEIHCCYTFTSSKAAPMHHVRLAPMDKALYSSTSLVWSVQAKPWRWPCSQQCLEGDAEALLLGCRAAHRALYMGSQPLAQSIQSVNYGWQCCWPHRPQTGADI